jgi:hypothetical protein
MAYQRKPLTARFCQQCGDPYHAVDRRRLYCCPGCKTAASQARRPSAAARAARRAADHLPVTAAPVIPPSAEGATESALAAPPAGPPNPSFGKLVLATAAGNLLTDAVKSFWTPTAAGRAPASGWPTWPPAELLAATGPPVLLTDPSWLAPQLLTPVTYHRHKLYLCVEEGLTVVLHQLSPGRWQYVRTPAQLAQLATQPPISPGMQALLAKYRMGLELPPSVPHTPPLWPNETPE